MLADTNREIVIVAGYAAERLELHIKNFYPSNQIKIIKNKDYAADKNILSLDIAVDALLSPELGYTVIETDLLLDPAAWKIINDAELTSSSFWVTHGQYNKNLTGGIVHLSTLNNAIDHIGYFPDYEADYDGWPKMLGIFSVSPFQVNADRYYRKGEIKKSYSQYYMVPWINNLKNLPCIAIDLKKLYAKSFNTWKEYATACLEYSSLFPEAVL